MYQRVVDNFGEEICDASGDIVRSALAEIVFFDETKRQRLNELIHPVVLDKLQDWMRICRMQGRRGVAEIPLLFECGWEQLPWDTIICVAADAAVVDKRMSARGLNAAERASRLASQWPVEKKCARADKVIWNSQKRVDVENTTRDLIERWT